MEGRDEIRRIAEAALRNIRQLTQLVGSDSNSTPQLNLENSAGSLESSNGCGPVRPISPNLPGTSTGTASSISQRPRMLNAITELRRRFPTTAISRSSRLPSSSSATRQRGRSAGRPHASGHVTKDIIILRVGEDRVPAKSEKAQLEREGKIITGLDIERSWTHEKLMSVLGTLLPQEYQGIGFQIMKNCNGTLVLPNIPPGRKVDANLLLKSIAPASCVYIQLLDDPIDESIFDQPAFENNPKDEVGPSTDQHASLSVDVVDLTHENNRPTSITSTTFIQEILTNAPSDLIEPVEILRFLPKKVVTGRALEIDSLSERTEGETNFITVDREKILETTFAELDYIENPRLTFQVDFMGEQSTDLGGPRKEWIRMVSREIKAKYFDQGLREGLSKDYRYVGQMFVIAMLQNGQMPDFLSEAVLQKLVSETEDQCIKEIQKGLESLGMLSALRKFPQLLYFLRPGGQSRVLTVQTVLHWLKPDFSENGSNAQKFEKEVYQAFVKYLREVAAGRRSSGDVTLSLNHILHLVTGASEEPVLGFHLKPSIKFVLPKEYQVQVVNADASEPSFKTAVAFTPSSHTCIHVLNLPRPTHSHALLDNKELFELYDLCSLTEQTILEFLTILECLSTDYFGIQ